VHGVGRVSSEFILRIAAGDRFVGSRVLEAHNSGGRGGIRTHEGA
jgi:hypothetical protein